MVWMEAVSAGLPVVASDLGGLARRVRQGVDGALVRPGDPVAMARAMEGTMDHYDTLRAGALERDVRSVTTAARQLHVIYEQALDRAGGGHGR